MYQMKMDKKTQKIIGHIEERNGIRIFVIMEDNRNISEIKKEEKNIEKMSDIAKKYRPDFIKTHNQFKD